MGYAGGADRGSLFFAVLVSDVKLSEAWKRC